MNDTENVRNFEYRPSRMKNGSHVDFKAGEDTLHGICRDVSDSGVRAEFDGSVEIGSSGVLILRHPSGVLNIEARVAYVENRQVGLVFLFKTPLERVVTTHFIAGITHYSVAPKPR
jgi:hypothetical protein